MTDSTTVLDAGRGRISIAVVDDHPVLRDGVASLLGAQPDMAVVETGGTVEDAQRILDAGDVDVLVLDVRLGTQSGLSALSRSQDGTRTQVVVLTAYAYPQYAEAAMRLGASGFVLKNAPIDELVAAIRSAAAGGIRFSVRPSARIILSRREREVVLLVVDGLSNDEIGSRLGISSKTVESHLRRIFERHGVSSRVELATRALSEGWLDLPFEQPPG